MTRHSLLVVTAIIAVALLAIGVVAYYEFATGVGTVYNTVQPTHTATTATNPTNGLELRLFVNTSSTTGVSVSVDAYNPSSSTANVTSASDWIVPLTGNDGAPCGDDTYAQNPTVGFAIAEGYYTPSNVTDAKLLNLVNPSVTYSCSLYLGYANPTGFLFQPMSDMAASYGCNQQRCMTGSASTGVQNTTSSWNEGGALISLPKGNYTVLAEDQWGALALAYFRIS
jgi:hypothetical protein